MISRIVTLLVAMAAPVLSRTAEVSLTPEPVTPSDTILRPALDLPPATVRSGLAGGDDGQYVTLGMRRIHVPDGIPRGRVPAGLAGRWRRPYTITPRPLTDVALRGRAERFGRPTATAFLPPAPVDPIISSAQESGRFVTDYADLFLNVRSRMELGGDWTRFEPCDARFGQGCNPSPIPQLRPDVQFGVVVNGSILDRVQVDVDFDQAREDAGANRINMFYQGGRGRRPSAASTSAT